MHKTLVFTIKVKVTIRGQGSSRFFSFTKKTTVVDIIKLRAKGNSNAVIFFFRIKVLLPKVRVTVRA